MRPRIAEAEFLGVCRDRFIVAAVALLAGWRWWQSVLVGTTLLSLALTALDWGDAYTGVMLNLVILALLWLVPRMTSWFAR